MSYTNGLDKPSDYFVTKLYTGNSTGSTQQAITGLDFSPNMVWIKPRSDAEKHSIADTVRGATKTIHPHLADAEETSAGHMVSFDANGYTVGVDNYSWNKNGSTYASWNWKETADAGFDMISYTGNGSSGRTISHNLNSVPSMIWTKDLGNAEHWGCYHKSLPAGYNIYLNLTNAEDDNNTLYTTTAPTSSVYSVGNNNRTNGNGRNYISYVFGEKQGYSKISSFVGNGANNFIYTGFSPAWVMIKKTDDTHDWHIFDNKRDVYNERDSWLEANNTQAEATSSNHVVDFLSNGFKTGSASGLNGSGETFIFMAFASNPLVTSTGVPATAR